MRLRHGPARVPREASPAPELTSLQSARLYFITPDRDPDDVAALVSAALKGGADAVQLRHKSLERGRLLDLAQRLRELTASHRALFVVDDFVDIALLSQADGVHLGPSDMTVESARRVAGDRLLIGASASSVDAAAEAIAQGADYLGSGPAFATPIKVEKAVIGPAAIAQIASTVAVPVFAIGGIEESNLGELTALGLRRACVIRAISDAPDPQRAARSLRAMLDR